MVDDLVNDLKFDEMEVDCELALNFLEKNKLLSMYPCIIEDEYTRNYKKVKSDYGINLFYSDKVTFYSNAERLTTKDFCYRTNIKKLQQKIKENEELFSQLEWLIRKIPKEQVKEFDITLMVQNIQYWIQQTEPCQNMYDNLKSMYAISFGDDTPLAVLGYVAQLLWWREINSNIIICSSPNTAVVCYLFTKLCHEVGIRHVATAIFEEPPTSLLDIRDYDRGCTAVITSKADYNSAIDAILSSTVKYPWKIRRVLVQEDIIDSVWAVLRYKEKLKEGENYDDTLQKLCKHIFPFGDKAILVEFAGEPSSIGPHDRHLIFLETYRTTKELLALLTSKSPFCLSIWSNDVNDVNVIAYGSPIDNYLIWINDYGTFDGPPQVSQTVYCAIELKYCRFLYNMEARDTILKMLPAWSKLDIYDRFDIVNKIIKDLISEEYSKRFYEDCFKGETNDTCTVKNGKIYNMMHYRYIHCSRNGDMKDIVALVKGHGVIILGDPNTIKINFMEMFKAIEDKGLPLLVHDKLQCRQLNVMNLKKIPKVIIQNCGAVFGN